MNESYDVIVVGGGGSGLAAGVSAAEHGAEVLLLEKQSELGGTTGIAVGSFTANRTRIQAEAGLSDSVEDHCADAARFANPEIEARNNDSLRRFFLAHTAQTLHWLMGMGLSFHGPSPEPPNRVARMHNVIPGAKAYIATLQARLLRLGGTIRAGAAVTRLHFEDRDTGRTVAGVTVTADGEQRTVRARRGVVLAAGDYAGSAGLIARFKGDQFSTIEGINPRAAGDGHRLAETAGADLVNMDVTYGPELRFVPPKGKTFQQLLPARGPVAKAAGLLMPLAPRRVVNAVIRRLLVTWQHPEDSLFADGAILVNRGGERFCDETVSPEREIALADQPSKEAFIVLDERLIRRYSRWPHFVSTAPKIAYAYVQDYLKLRADVAIEAADIVTLAKHRGLPGRQLAVTIDRWNRDAESDSTRTPLSGTRWVCLGPVKAYFTTTEGGAAINEQLQVLDRHGNPIPGLYAVGQNGLGGQILWGHGLHIAWAITSGRLVGRELAAGSSPTR